MIRHNSNLQVIVASAEAPLRRILSHTFEALGAQVEQVASHKALTTHLLHKNYDLIVTRFIDPLLDNKGWMVVARKGIKRGKLWVIADHLTAEEAVALLERGVSQILSLPISTTRLKHKIESELNKGHQQCSSTP